ncbi:Hypothetical protein GbCGDNIH3_7080 [Granulibacter bethesdensis]|uniref:Helix-turn-helix domain-containing protein n=1 Tax=Granulibacter bethesdensis TaxID=364410 RepID=A0AAN0VG46_9PROT|nr:Hypothetical protein GbCGDNIH3_7080 [Granulibacter bethesdensis]
MANVTPLYLSLKEAAVVAGCHQATLRRAIHTGRIRYGKAGNRYRLSYEHIKEYLESEWHENEAINRASSSETASGASNSIKMDSATDIRQARQMNRLLKDF